MAQALKDFNEAAHANADNILCGLLRKLGFGDVIDVYDKVPQW